MNPSQQVRTRWNDNGSEAHPPIDSVRVVDGKLKILPDLYPSMHAMKGLPGILSIAGRRRQEAGTASAAVRANYANRTLMA